MIRRALVALLTLAVCIGFVACGDGDDAATTPAGSSGGGAVLGTEPPGRVLVLGDSNLFESSEQVERALSGAGFVPTLGSYPGLGLKDLDGYWRRELPALLDDDPDVVVVALGTNDTSDQADVDAFASRLDTMMETLGDRAVVWVTHVDPRPLEVPGGAAAVNAAIRAAPERWPNLTVLDRTPVLAADRSLVRDDELHFTEAGKDAFAAAIARAVVERERVREPG